MYAFTDADLLPRRTSLAAALCGLLAGTDIARWIDDAGFRPAGAAMIAAATTRWTAPCAGEAWGRPATRRPRSTPCPRTG